MVFIVPAILYNYNTLYYNGKDFDLWTLSTVVYTVTVIVGTYSILCCVISLTIKLPFSEFEIGHVYKV
jgi:hypothetical protein